MASYARGVGGTSGFVEVGMTNLSHAAAEQFFDLLSGLTTTFWEIHDIIILID